MKNSTPSSNQYIFGIHPVLESLKSGTSIEKIYIQNNIKLPNMTSLRKYIKQMKIPYVQVPLQKMNKLSRKNHQGIIALISIIQTKDIETIIPSIYEDGKIPFILALDQLTDVRNFGSICRTADCAGINAVIIPKKKSAQINSDAIKSSSGALYHLNICKTDNLFMSLEFLKNSGLQIISCTEKASDTIYQIKYNIPTVVVIGNEENGISKNILNISSHKVKIPMFGKIQSLNASVATSVLAYEIVRQRLNL